MISEKKTSFFFFFGFSVAEKKIKVSSSISGQTLKWWHISKMKEEFGRLWELEGGKGRDYLPARQL